MSSKAVELLLPRKTFQQCIEASTTTTTLPQELVFVHKSDLLMNFLFRESKRHLPMKRARTPKEEIEQLKQGDERFLHLQNVTVQNNALHATLVCQQDQFFMPFLFANVTLPSVDIVLEKGGDKILFELPNYLFDTFTSTAAKKLKELNKAPVESIAKICVSHEANSGSIMVHLKAPWSIPCKFQNVQITTSALEFLVSESYFTNHSVRLDAVSILSIKDDKIASTITIADEHMTLYFDSIDKHFAEFLPVGIHGATMQSILTDPELSIATLTNFHGNAMNGTIDQVTVKLDKKPVYALPNGTTVLNRMEKNGLDWKLEFDKMSLTLKGSSDIKAKYEDKSKYLLAEQVLKTWGYNFQCNSLFRPMIVHTIASEFKCTMKAKKIAPEYTAAITFSAQLDEQTTSMFAFNSLWRVQTDAQQVPIVCKDAEARIDATQIRYFGWKVEWIQGFKVVATFKSSSSNTGKMDARGSNISMTVSQFLHLAKRIAPVSLPVEVLKKNLTMFALDLDKFELIAKHFISKAGSVAITWNELQDSVVLVYEGKEYNLPFDPRQRLTPASGFTDIKVVAQWDKFE